MYFCGKTQKDSHNGEIIINVGKTSDYSVISEIIVIFAPSFQNNANMDLTISMNTVLNILHSMALSTSNKQWLADHLYEEVKEERKAATANSGWPKIRREDMRISPEVMKLVEDIQPLPDDFDYDKARLDYLLKKHG